MSDTEQPSPEVGDEINYRSMEGCTVATVEEVRDEGVALDNGAVVPDHCILEVLNREVYSERVLYLTSVQCQQCQRKHTFAHDGHRVSLDQEAPWPAVDCCTWCGSEYPDDLAEVITEVGEAERADPQDTGTDRSGGEASE